MVLMTLVMRSPLSAHVVGQINDVRNRSSPEERSICNQVHLKMHIQ
jgi:hypothetical protein